MMLKRISDRLLDVVWILIIVAFILAFSLVIVALSWLLYSIFTGNFSVVNYEVVTEAIYETSTSGLLGS